MPHLWGGCHAKGSTICTKQTSPLENNNTKSKRQVDFLARIVQTEGLTSVSRPPFCEGRALHGLLRQFFRTAAVLINNAGTQRLVN